MLRISGHRGRHFRLFIKRPFGKHAQNDESGQAEACTRNGCGHKKGLAASLSGCRWAVPTARGIVNGS
jgi:hypothetical protein